jgi:hypothetical protein
MKLTLEDIKEGEFFEYRAADNEENYALYQKLIGNKHYNAVLLNNGEACILHTQTPIFKRVSVNISIEREIT